MWDAFPVAAGILARLSVERFRGPTGEGSPLQARAGGVRPRAAARARARGPAEFGQFSRPNIVRVCAAEDLG